MIGNKELLNINSDDIVQTWLEIKEIKNNLNDTMFAELADYILCLLSLPHSSAAAERTFSVLLQLKKKKQIVCQIKLFRTLCFVGHY